MDSHCSNSVCFNGYSYLRYFLIIWFTTYLHVYYLPHSHDSLKQLEARCLCLYIKLNMSLHTSIFQYLVVLTFPLSPIGESQGFLLPKEIDACPALWIYGKFSQERGIGGSYWHYDCFSRLFTSTLCTIGEMIHIVLVLCVLNRCLNNVFCEERC